MVLYLKHPGCECGCQESSRTRWDVSPGGSWDQCQTFGNETGAEWSTREHLQLSKNRLDSCGRVEDTGKLVLVYAGGLRSRRLHMNVLQFSFRKELSEPRQAKPPLGNLSKTSQFQQELCIFWGKGAEETTSAEDAESILSDKISGHHFLGMCLASATAHMRGR